MKIKTQNRLLLAVIFLEVLFFIGARTVALQQQQEREADALLLKVEALKESVGSLTSHLDRLESQ